MYWGTKQMKTDCTKSDYFLLWAKTFFTSLHVCFLWWPMFGSYINSFCLSVWINMCPFLKQLLNLQQIYIRIYLLVNRKKFILYNNCIILPDINYNLFCVVMNITPNSSDWEKELHGFCCKIFAYNLLLFVSKNLIL